MTTKKQIYLAALLFAGAAIAASQEPAAPVNRAGDEWVQELRGSLTPAKKIAIRTYAGSIRILGTSQAAVTYIVRKHVRNRSQARARAELSRMRIVTSNSGDTLLIRGDTDAVRRGSIDLEISLPQQTALAILQTRGGPIVARNISGKVEARTGGDSIQLDQIGSDVVAYTGGGDIEIGTIGGEVHAETGGGNIHVGYAAGQVVALSGGGTVAVDAGKTVKLETGGGPIRVGKCPGEVKASTGGGSIDLAGAGGPVQVESGGGSIRLGALSGGVLAATGSGPIIADLAASRGAFTASHLETSAGDIVVYVPDDLGVTVRAAVEIARGDGINSDLPGLTITRTNPQWGPRNVRAEGSFNGGGPVLTVHTATGTIYFKRKNRK